MSKKLAIFNADQKTIDVIVDPNDQNTSTYEIDLVRATNSAELLDWILQVAEKSWCTPQHLFDLIEEIGNTCLAIFGNSPQGVYCPGGSDRKVDWSQDESV